MTAGVYDSARLAAAYAFDRPPVHERLLRPARLDRPARQALDIGCGAGLSTAALTGAGLARHVVGLEPVAAMLAHRPAVAPHARGAYGAEEARDWCRATLEPVFAGRDLTVVIPGYVATLGRAEEDRKPRDAEPRLRPSLCDDASSP